MSDARNVVAREVATTRDLKGNLMIGRATLKRADAILSALSAMPLASRLALARALVPGWAVVPVEPSRQMMECAVVRHYNKGSLAEVWTAMLTAAEAPDGL